MNTYKKHTHCRVCGSARLTPYLDLGMMPLSNSLLNDPDEVAERFPLVVAFCEDCSLSQLTTVIPPEKMFNHYVYRSGISQGYKDHCFQMAKDLKHEYGLDDRIFHIDIAGNDGTLIDQFRKVLGNEKCLNVDPAANLLPINEALGIRQYTEFWGLDAAKHLVNVFWPKADIITATNVFAHVDNAKEFLEAVDLVLAPTGICVLEFPYIVDFIENKEFDTVYFEHLSYFSIYPLVKLANEIGLRVLDVQHKAIHGGSVRVVLGKAGEPKPSVNAYLKNEFESGYQSISKYKQWALDVRQIITEFRAQLCTLRMLNKLVVGFAASAKGNTLLNAAGIGSDQMYCIFDETPEKIGKFSPGTGIQIVPIDLITAMDLQYIVILSWNFADEIIAKCKKHGYKGKFILPLTQQII